MLCYESFIDFTQLFRPHHSLDLKSICSTNSLTHSLSVSIWTAFMHLGLGPDLLGTGVWLFRPHYNCLIVYSVVSYAVPDVSKGICWTSYCAEVSKKSVRHS